MTEVERLKVYDELDKEFPGILDCRDNFYLPPGWVGIFRNALSRCGTRDRPPHVVQVKEKFGELRIYHAGEGSALFLAEQLSTFVCQRCGTTLCGVDTRTAPGGLVSTLCQNCL